MQTSFTLAQLADPDIKEADSILRRCVHCGFCLATCPTYLELGNELDSPRGRIYLIKDMLENDKPASEEVTLHIDRCLSCLSCMTTCPSGVDYMHLVDQARVRIEKTYKRPFHDRLLRALLARVLPYRRRFRAALHLARLGRLAAPLLPRWGASAARMQAMLSLAPDSLQKNEIKPGRSFTPAGERKGRVALLTGLRTVGARPRHQRGDAAAPQPLRRGGGVSRAGRLLRRHRASHGQVGAGDAAGAPQHRCVDGGDRRRRPRCHRYHRVGLRHHDQGLRPPLPHDPDYAEKARRVSELALDITEYLAKLDLPPGERGSDLVVAYHSACSMQHGQRITTLPKTLLQKAGFEVRDVPEGHICCGSAGTYNLLQPEIAARLRDRKVKNIESVAPDVVATGNIGCIAQIAPATIVPVMHTVELLDWAYGSDRSDFLRRRIGAPGP